MFETMASFMLVEHANGAMFNPPLGEAFYPRAVSRNRRPYKTRDGYVAALIYNDKQWRTFVEAVKPPWASEPQYATLEQRAKRIDEVYALLGETFEARTTQEWLDLFHSLGIPAAPLRTPADLMRNEHLEAVGFYETVDSPHGPVRFPGIPTWFSETPAHIAAAAPELGAHTKEILEELERPAVDRRPARQA
jgi:crotonobetainyl-CoA:carnitine CoA-transferase CaiB-like acyl-CoA transferase